MVLAACSATTALVCAPECGYQKCIGMCTPWRSSTSGLRELLVLKWFWPVGYESEFRFELIWVASSLFQSLWISLGRFGSPVHRTVRCLRFSQKIIKVIDSEAIDFQIVLHRGLVEILRGSYGDPAGDLTEIQPRSNRDPTEGLHDTRLSLEQGRSHTNIFGGPNSVVYFYLAILGRLLIRILFASNSSAYFWTCVYAA